jgi:hypothetical protein
VSRTFFADFIGEFPLVRGDFGFFPFAGFVLPFVAVADFDAAVLFALVLFDFVYWYKSGFLLDIISVDVGCFIIILTNHQRIS